MQAAVPLPAFRPPAGVCCSSDAASSAWRCHQAAFCSLGAPPTTDPELHDAPTAAACAPVRFWAVAAAPTYDEPATNVFIDSLCPDVLETLVHTLLLLQVP